MEDKGKIIGIRIFVADQSPKKHDCYKNVSEEEFRSFLSDNPNLESDMYMEQQSYYDSKMVMVAKITQNYSDNTFNFFIRRCFVKHRSKPVDESKGSYHYIECQTSAGLTITSN